MLPVASVLPPQVKQKSLKGLVFGLGKLTLTTGGFTSGSFIFSGDFIFTLSLGSPGALVSGSSITGTSLSMEVGFILAFTTISALGSSTISKSVIPY